MKKKTNTIIFYIIAAAVILSFGVFGVIYFTPEAGVPSNALVVVNREPIYWNRDMAYSFNNMLEYWKQRIPDLNEQYQQLIFNSYIQQVVEEKIAEQAVKKYGIKVSNARVNQKIIDSGLFYDEQGKFAFSNLPKDQQLYYFNKFKKDISREILENDISFASIFTTEFDLTKYFHVTHDLYKFEYYYIPISDVSDDELAKYYETVKNNYEVMQAAHILVKDLETAQKISVELKADPNKFIEYVVKYSTDEGSKINGGDLGIFDRKTMVKEFSDAAFKLTKPGEISEPVKSEFGFHIIKCIKPPYIPSLSDPKIKEKVLEDYSAVNEAILVDKAKNVANEVYNLFEKNDLKTIEKKYNLELKRTGEFAYRDTIVDETNTSIAELSDANDIHDALYLAKKNEVIKPIRTQKGFIVAKVLSKEIGSDELYRLKHADILRDVIGIYQYILTNDWKSFLQNNSKVVYPKNSPVNNGNF